MTDIAQRERNTQNRIVQLFADRLDYEYLGDWQDREGNSNVEESYLRAFLKQQGYKPNIIDKAVHELTKAAGIQTEDLYDSVTLGQVFKASFIETGQKSCLEIAPILLEVEPSSGDSPASSE